MRWLVTGGEGMLARDLVAEGRARGLHVIAIDKAEADLLDPEAIAAAVREAQPDVVINCAAWTAVDDAELNEAAAFAVNAAGAQNVARATQAVGAKLVQISTDYVFSGAKRDGEGYPANAPLSPIGAYGRTKASGEWAALANCDNVYIVRTAWLYGAGGNCFPKTLARILTEQGSAKVVDDQYGQPTWTVDLSRLIVDLLDQAPPGLYHGTSSGQTTWCGFTRAIAESLGMSPSVVIGVRTEEFPRPAPRPQWSVLDHTDLEAVGVEPIGNWDERWRVAAPHVLGV